MADYRQALSHGKTSLRQDRFLDLGGQLPVAWLRDLGGSVVIFFLLGYSALPRECLLTLMGQEKLENCVRPKIRHPGLGLIISQQELPRIASVSARLPLATYGVPPPLVCVFFIFFSTGLG